MKVAQLFGRSKRQRFEILVKPHLQRLYARAYRLTLSEQQAEDLVQEMLMNLYAKNQDLSALKDVRSWLMRSLYNLYVDHWRKWQNNPLNHLDAQGCDEVQAVQNTPSEQYEHAQSLGQLEIALGQLSPEHRQLIVMHDMEGYTLNELVTELATPIGTLKSRLHRARAKLRKMCLDREPSLTEIRVVK